MKKYLSMLLCAVLLCSAALAEVPLDGGEDRGIVINEAEPNDPEPMVSPVTGRYLDEVAAKYYSEGFVGQAVTGRYMPIMVQIDNSDGGIGYGEDGKVTYNRAPWGVEYSDVIYETPLYKDGHTRLTFLFSDIIPDEVGPVRSARLFHAWLREEWDCGFAFYGQQTYTATNVEEVFKQTGATQKANGLLLFSGTVGSSKPWKQYYDSYQRTQLSKPHHISANLAGMSSLIPPDFEAKNHTWLFTDKTPDGDDAETIYINWATGNLAMYNSFLEWDEDDEVYYRYMIDPFSGKWNEYSSFRFSPNGQNPIPFNNIIIQFTKMEWKRTDAPDPTVLGTGNADYFMCGKHISGVWQRKTMDDRTVFYDDEGEEIALQRGRTLIVVMDYEFEHRSVSYE